MRLGEISTAMGGVIGGRAISSESSMMYKMHTRDGRAAEKDVDNRNLRGLFQN